MMWLSDYSTPSLEGYHKYGALIGPGQTTGSTGGFDYLHPMYTQDTFLASFTKSARDGILTTEE